MWIGLIYLFQEKIFKLAHKANFNPMVYARDLPNILVIQKVEIIGVGKDISGRWNYKTSGIVTLI